ncbi:MAG TPA: hypothetical protein VF848_04330 [Steroidobacteraceae bacterium]
MKVFLPLAALAAVAATPAFADCVAPVASITVPDSTTATKDELVATSKAIKAYDQDVQTFTGCLAQEEDGAIAALGDKATPEQKAKVQKQYELRSNNEVDKLHALADKLNIAIRAYKARNPTP